MKIVDNREPLLAPNNKDRYTIQFEKDQPSLEAHVSHFIKLLVQQMLVDNMADSQHGLKVLDLVEDHESPPKRLEFEDADYTWLVKKVDSAAPKIFGLMAQRFRDALEPMSVADKKAARNGKQDAAMPEEEPAPTEV